MLSVIPLNNITKRIHNEDNIDSDIIKSIHNLNNNIFNKISPNNPLNKTEKTDINNIDIGKINEVESIEFKNNIKKENNIYLCYNKYNKKFIIKDIQYKLLGSFTILDIIKYITHYYDIEKNYLNYIILDNNTKYLIETFIIILYCTIIFIQYSF